MDQLTIAAVAPDDAKLATYLDSFTRRINATPPGMCPIALQLSLVQASAAQTCGKCVACREGLPQLAKMLEELRDCTAAPDALDRIRNLATTVHQASDCAIGFEAGKLVLDSLDDFAEEYRTHAEERHCRKGVSQTIPCETGCPAHVNVPGYISLVQNEDYAGAIKMVRKDNPFVTACALICEHPCEHHCRRMLIDAPLNIRGIKKYAVDNIPADKVPVPARHGDTGKKIAIIGGGPSGLTCAYFSALMGHKVTVFEGRKHLGGMMRYGIPAYRFPRERLMEDVRAIESVGNIDIQMEHQVDAEELKKLAEEYDAIYVAIGAQLAKPLDMEGIDAEGVELAVNLTGKVGDDELPDYTGKKVVVIGGGNVAIDCARTSLRAGASEVAIVYRRRIDDMTALDDEIESAIAEGVEMITLEAPVRIETNEAGHCTALISQPQYIGPVKRGRPAPVAADAPETRTEADVILVAVGQGIDSGTFEEYGMKTKWDQLEADDNLLATGFENIFVGGDCLTGPKTVIMAIGEGKVAARNIDTYLGYYHKLDPEVEAPLPNVSDPVPCGRVNVTERYARLRKQDFDHSENDLSHEEIMQECSRCLRCDFYGNGTSEGGRVQYV